MYILYDENGKFVLQGIPPTSHLFFKTCFPSYAALLVALLNHLIYSVPLPDVDDFLLLDNATSIDSIKTYINDIFLHAIDVCFEQDTPSERYAVHAAADRTLRNPAFTTEYYTDSLFLAAAAHEAGTTLTSLEREILKKYCDMPEERVFAYAMRQIAHMRNIKIHGADQYCFPNISSLVLWLIGKAARANQRISMCPVCGHYFQPTRSNQKFCSPACRRANMNSVVFHGEKEIMLAYKRNHTLLSSKAACSKEQHRSYIVLATNTIYDISALKRDYEWNNAKRLDAFHDAYKNLQENPSRETKEAYIQKKEDYLNWLNEQHQFIKSLRLDIWGDYS